MGSAAGAPFPLIPQPALPPPSFPCSSCGNGGARGHQPVGALCTLSSSTCGVSPGPRHPLGCVLHPVDSPVSGSPNRPSGAWKTGLPSPVWQGPQVQLGLA